MSQPAALRPCERRRWLAELFTDVRVGSLMRPATTIALALLLAAIFIAAIVQFAVIGGD